jgi:hypothetical protein
MSIEEQQRAYLEQIESLQRLTGLTVLPIGPMALDVPREIQIYPEDAEWFRPVGIRIFTKPERITIDSIKVGLMPTPASASPTSADPYRTTIESDQGFVVRGPFDAACYDLDLLPPIPIDEHYRGEPMRFVMVDFPVVGRLAPLLIAARRCDHGVTEYPTLYGYLVGTRLSLASTAGIDPVAILYRRAKSHLDKKGSKA